MTETTRTFTLDQLAISPLNVRFNEEDCAAVEALSASIVAEGLLQPLVLHPAPEDADWTKDGQIYGVLAGGRRYRAIRRAIDAGELPADFPIAASVHDLPKGAIILLSLSENLLRRNLREYEVHRAIAAAHAEGLDERQIAVQLGQRPEWIAQQLRLGELHPDVFGAYMGGNLSADQAKAYAATDDHELQLATLQHFEGEPNYVHTPAAIRAFMKVGDAELKRQLLFVGEAIYRGRGGRFELDLFADGPDADRGRIVDEDLLQELVTEKMEVLRSRIREDLGARDLRFQPRPPQFGGSDDVALELSGSGDWRKTKLGCRPVECFVAVIEIDREGEWHPRIFWTSRKVKGEHTREKVQIAPSAFVPKQDEALASQVIGYDQEACRIVRDDHGLASDGLNIMRSLRRDLLRALLIERGRYWGTESAMIARDYLTWSQLRQELTSDRDYNTGSRGLQRESWNAADREPTELLRPQREDQQFWKDWTVEREALSLHPAFKLEDPAEALEAYLDADPAVKRAAEALLAGLALIRSANTPGYKVAVHDVLARRLRASDRQLRRYWEPSPAFAGLFGKMKRLELAQPFVEESAFRSWHTMKDKPLTGATAAALQGLYEGAAGHSAETWIHPLLAFDGMTQSESPDEDEREQENGPDDETVPDEVMTVEAGTVS